jgi:2-oxoglutarate ferredoxin oxidoreductase subunit delta
MAKLTIHTEICKGCSLCVYACPKQLLSLSPTKLNAKGYQPVQIIDETACTGCAACARTCPDLVIEIDK